MKEKIKVLALLPMQPPKELELDNTLEAMQKFVGGLIECASFSVGAAVSSAASLAILSGSDNVTVVPTPSSLEIWMVPPIRSSRLFTMGIPSPVPI